MIRNKQAVQNFKNEIVKKEKADPEKNFRLIDAMYREAVFLGVFPAKDLLSGLEVDLKIAKVINSVSKAS